MGLRDIVGQDRAVRMLLRALERGRTPSSYVFAGEPGIGKKLTALNLAKALNCIADRRDIPHGGGRDSCDACISCNKIDRSVHPDVTVISPDSGQIKIEMIREIDDILSYKPYEGTHKVIVVDEAETMNQFAANAFLKTLEEPPNHSLIILITSNPERLPDTILSRCSRINFVPLALHACKEVIRKSIRSDRDEKDPRMKPAVQRNLNDADIEMLARLCMGRPGIAVSEDLLEQRNRSLALFKTIGQPGRDAWSSREDMEQWFEYALTLMRDMAVLRTRQGERRLINPDIKEDLIEASGAADLKGIIDMYQQVLAVRKYLRFNLNKSLTWNYVGSLLRKGMGRRDA